MGRRFNLGTDVISNRHARRRAKALAKRSKKKMAKQKLHSFQEMESLDPRILLSASPMDDANGTPQPTPTPTTSGRARSIPTS